MLVKSQPPAHNFIVNRDERGCTETTETISHHVLVSKANGLDNPPFNAPPSDRCKFVVVVSDGI